MSTVAVNGSNFGNALQDILMAEDIEPGDQPSYNLCKQIYLFHPLGQKMTESPVKKAMSQQRNISVPQGPEDRIVEQFKKTWNNLGGKDIGADELIFQVCCFARVYGISTLALMIKGQEPSTPVDFKNLSKETITFNMYDPLNTAGSLVLNQNTNALDFMKVKQVAVNGKQYHPSRTCVIMNERPVYIAFTTSSFGFVGRSVYQRALYPLKSFLQTMLTDDLVTVKAGVLVAKIKQAGSIISNQMMKLFGIKRDLIKEAATGNVLSVGQEDDIESLNFQNLDGPYKLVRENILKNIATAADMPAVLLENETLTEGFGEGVEDAKTIADYIDGIRKWMAPVYKFLDDIVMHIAWNEEFYATIQNDFPDYKNRPFTQSFYEWKNSFHAEWPSLLKEPPSEKIKVDQTKLEAIVSLVEALKPDMDPENKAILIEWAADNFNNLKVLFPNPLELDYEALKDYVPPEQVESELGKQDDRELKPKTSFGDSSAREISSAFDLIKRLPRNARQ